MRRLLLVGLVALAAALPAAAATPSFLVRGDTSFAGLGFGSKLADAKRVFGTPSTVRTDREVCTATWKRHGLVVKFFSFEPKPCATGTALIVTMTDPRWHTNAGLHVGDVASTIKRHYGHATLRTNGWWLVTRKACELGNFEPYAALLARVRGGRVTALVLSGSVCD